MKNLKKALVSFVIMAALVSTSAFAGKDDAKVLAAGEATIAKTQEAYDILEKGGNKDDVLKLLSEVRQSQKEFRFEGTERLRQRSGNELRVAREEVENGAANAKTSLKKVLDTFNEMMVSYKAAH